ncbi:hypothetical protein M8C21_016921, partial [Ambrosia artemisiifolia]
SITFKTSTKPYKITDRPFTSPVARKERTPVLASLGRRPLLTFFSILSLGYLSCTVMNHNQQSNDVRHDDENTLSEFLASLTDYTPTIPDELVEHYLAKSGFQCPDVRITRLVAVAAQKFVSDIATDALQHCKARQASVVRDKKDKQQKDKRLIMNMEDLSKALQEEYFADNPSAGLESASKDE